MTTYINWTNITDFSNIFGEANTASNGSFWVGMLYMMWIILILILLGYGFEVSITISSFLALIIGILFAYAGFVAWGWVLTFLGILLFMFLYIIWSNSQK